jgi:hypothetical protein
MNDSFVRVRETSNIRQLNFISVGGFRGGFRVTGRVRFLDVVDGIVRNNRQATSW